MPIRADQICNPYMHEHTYTLLVFIDEIFEEKLYTYFRPDLEQLRNTAISIIRLSRRKGKRSNMSAKGLSGKTSFIDFIMTLTLSKTVLFHLGIYKN